MVRGGKHGGVAMKYTTGIAICLAVLLVGLYTWGISTDPDGLGALVRDSERPSDGAVPLASVEANSQADDELTYGALAAQVAQSDLFHLAPPEASDLDGDFMSFLSEMRSAVEARDIEAILSRSTSDIFLSFGSQGGHDVLRRLLSDPQAATSYWQELKAVLQLPAARGAEGLHCAPYFTCMNLPQEAGLIEPFDTAFIVSKDVSVFAEPDAAAAPLMKLSFDVVKVLEFAEDPDWVRIALPGGEAGYVRSSTFRTLFDFRASFEKIEGFWLMTSFVAGQ
jgi:hypothetical protein